MARMQQQELKPQTPAPPGEEMDDLYEEEPQRRSWGAIASVVLALSLVFVGYQWHQAAGRADLLASQLNALRAEAETQRLRAEDAQRQVDGLQRRVAAMSAEREALAERVAALEKSRERAMVARERSRGGAGPVARETTRARVTPVAAKRTR